MLPKWIESDLCAAWLEGGTSAYAYLGALWEWACKARDYELAATADWLEDILNSRTASEIINTESN